MLVSRLSLIVAAAAFSCCAAAQNATPAQIQQTYARDKAACEALAGDARATCLREAGAADQAARAGQLTSADAATYQANALRRCDVFKSRDDRADCLDRMGAGAQVEGSVQGGGLLRESVRTITTQP
ncbi:hypothetical protein GCM10022279_06670 [Comamonas faecalis]|uniref:DUF1311 domain-containing protein n=1 Tax=Comamonas faecalis TaxID=1387849 RepID=A0ABP7QQ59_9BURK